MTPGLHHPFAMRADRGAQARYEFVDSRGKTRQVIKDGRASFVWLWAVLIPLATGTADQVEIRQRNGGPQGNGPWHTVRGSEEAYAEILAAYRMQGAMKREVTRRRQQRGLAT